MHVSCAPQPSGANKSMTQKSMSTARMKKGMTTRVPMMTSRSMPQRKMSVNAPLLMIIMMVEPMLRTTIKNVSNKILKRALMSW